LALWTRISLLLVVCSFEAATQVAREFDAVASMAPRRDVDETLLFAREINRLYAEVAQGQFTQETRASALAVRDAIRMTESEGLIGASADILVSLSEVPGISQPAQESAEDNKQNGLDRGITAARFGLMAGSTYKGFEGLSGNGGTGDSHALLIGIGASLLKYGWDALSDMKHEQTRKSTMTQARHMAESEAHRKWLASLTGEVEKFRNLTGELAKRRGWAAMEFGNDADKERVAFIQKFPEPTAESEEFEILQTMHQEIERFAPRSVDARLLVLNLAAQRSHNLNADQHLETALWILELARLYPDRPCWDLTRNQFALVAAQTAIEATQKRLQAAQAPAEWKGSDIATSLLMRLQSQGFDQTANLAYCLLLQGKTENAISLLRRHPQTEGADLVMRLSQTRLAIEQKDDLTALLHLKALAESWTESPDALLTHPLIASTSKANLIEAKKFFRPPQLSWECNLSNDELIVRNDSPYPLTMLNVGVRIIRFQNPWEAEWKLDQLAAGEVHKWHPIRTVMATNANHQGPTTPPDSYDILELNVRSAQGDTRLYKTRQEPLLDGRSLPVDEILSRFAAPRLPSSSASVWEYQIDQSLLEMPKEFNRRPAKGLALPSDSRRGSRQRP
jgi:hypothetical protein